MILSSNQQYALKNHMKRHVSNIGALSYLFLKAFYIKDIPSSAFTSFQVAFEVTTLEGISAKRWGRFLQGHMGKNVWTSSVCNYTNYRNHVKKGQTHFPMYVYVFICRASIPTGFGWILSTLAVHLSWKDIAKTT